MHKLTTQDLIACSSQMQGHLVPCFYDLGIILSISWTFMDYNSVESPQVAEGFPNAGKASKHLDRVLSASTSSRIIAIAPMSTCTVGPVLCQRFGNRTTMDIKQRKQKHGFNRPKAGLLSEDMMHSVRHTFSDQADLKSQQRFSIATSIPLHSCPASDQSIDEQSTCGRRPL